MMLNEMRRITNKERQYKNEEEGEKEEKDR